MRCQKEMGQANEKFSKLDDTFRGVETERDSLRKKVKETEIKIEVFTFFLHSVTHVQVLKKKQSDEQTTDQHVKELESALEEVMQETLNARHLFFQALVEREQILLACEKEIEQERDIAIELEQKMLEDFELKLREVEGGYKTQIKTLEDGLESKVSKHWLTCPHAAHLSCPCLIFSC